MLLMNILLVAATAKEIEPFLAEYRKTKKMIAVDVVITGVGLTATTYHLLKQLSIKKPAVVIQAGVAGCFDKDTPLGTVVVVKQDVIADQMVMESGKLKTVFDLGLLAKDQPPYSNGWLVNKSDILKKIDLPKVRAISVNEISTAPEAAGIYKELFKPVVESLEGAALHYVCLMEKIPFVQLRSISNYIGERDKKNWDLTAAIRSLNKELIKLTEQLTE
jgi:futalosine hydrolase